MSQLADHERNSEKIRGPHFLWISIYWVVHHFCTVLDKNKLLTSIISFTLFLAQFSSFFSISRMVNSNMYVVACNAIWQHTMYYRVTGFFQTKMYSNNFSEKSILQLLALFRDTKWLQSALFRNIKFISVAAF